MSQNPEGSCLREILKVVGPVKERGLLMGLSLSSKLKACWLQDLISQGAELTSKVVSCWGVWPANIAGSGASKDHGH